MRTRCAGGCGSHQGDCGQSLWWSSVAASASDLGRDPGSGPERSAVLSSPRGGGGPSRSDGTEGVSRYDELRGIPPTPRHYVALPLRDGDTSPDGGRDASARNALLPRWGSGSPPTPASAPLRRRYFPPASGGTMSAISQLPTEASREATPNGERERRTGLAQGGRFAAATAKPHRPAAAAVMPAPPPTTQPPPPASLQCETPLSCRPHDSTQNHHRRHHCNVKREDFPCLAKKMGRAALPSGGLAGQTAVTALFDACGLRRVAEYP